MLWKLHNSTRKAENKSVLRIKSSALFLIANKDENEFNQK